MTLATIAASLRPTWKDVMGACLPSPAITAAFTYAANPEGQRLEAYKRTVILQLAMTAVMLGSSSILGTETGYAWGARTAAGPDPLVQALDEAQGVSAVDAVLVEAAMSRAGLVVESEVHDATLATLQALAGEAQVKGTISPEEIDRMEAQATLEVERGDWTLSVFDAWAGNIAGLHLQVMTEVEAARVSLDEAGIVPGTFVPQDDQVVDAQILPVLETLRSDLGLRMDQIALRFNTPVPVLADEDLTPRL